MLSLALVNSSFLSFVSICQRGLQLQQMVDYVHLHKYVMSIESKTPCVKELHLLSLLLKGTLHCHS